MIQISFGRPRGRGIASSVTGMQPPASTETKVDPPGLTKIRERVKELIPDSTESWDRRGFRLLEGGLPPA